MFEDRKRFQKSRGPQSVSNAARFKHMYLAAVMNSHG